ncbi:MAG: integral rane sensor signal transduction histidine kinase [Massilibacillus sp.]|jgi:signal transduction histidine kinase|nr:integral rane sensor signal transduction histidine kinase [Massilibacillus sp.]
MFKKLRLKLTLINVSVIVTLFVILSVSLYALFKMTSNQNTMFMLIKIGNEVMYNQKFQLPSQQKNKDHPDQITDLIRPPKPYFFYVKVASDGSIIMQSTGVTITDSQLSTLINTVMSNPNNYASVDFEDIPFTYLRTDLPKENDTLIVFNDKSEEKEHMNQLITHLLLVGLFCSLLSFFASFFMAKHAIKPIQTSLEQQNNFVSDASHELRTPITIIQTNLDIIKGAPNHETIAENKKWLNNIQDETTCMTELINSLLFLARADVNQQLMEKEYFQLNLMILNAVHPFEVIAKRNNITLTTDINSPVTALGDSSRLKQVLTILIDNALRHTPEHGSVVAGCHAKDDFIYITLTDTGEGIDKKHLEKIFDRFYQVDESRHKGGSGLGLSMAKWIVEKHGGAISVKSTLGKGTTFTIKLPTK